MIARVATIVALVTACSDRSAPLPRPSPWARTMTLAERRAWVATCAGTDEISVFEGRDLARYSADRRVTVPRADGGGDLRRQIWCDLDWDPHRGRLESLGVSIDASQDEELDDALVAPYLVLVLDEMTPSAREAALATRWGSFAFGCVDPRSHSFHISCDVTQSLHRWTWGFQVRVN